jgi:hypothetical protein
MGRPIFKALLLDDSAEGQLIVRCPESRPMVKVTAYLSSVFVGIAVEVCSSAAASYVERANHRIDFGVDGDGKLSLCMECSQVTLDDVAKLILRHALGLA